MKVAIVGFGTEGQAAYRYWLAQGANLTVHDANTEMEVPKPARAILGPDYLEHLDQYDLIVRSPSVPPWKLKTSRPVTSVTREFFKQCPARIIGVTGTKGKGTTSSLIAEMLKAAGHRVWLGGNIGTAPLDFLSKVKPDDLVVLELSSFQLIDVDASPAIGVLLLIEPEHQDWHRSLQEYVEAKGNIFRYQEAADLAVFNARNDFATKLVRLSAGRHLPYLEKPGAYIEDNQIMMNDTPVCRLDEVALPGLHNAENVCAAVAATWELVERRIEPIRKVIQTFAGLPHRLETLGVADDITYVNDAYAGNPAATVAAIRSFSQPKVMIMGGLNRGLAMDDLAAAVADGGVRRALLIGQTAPIIAKALDRAGFGAYELVEGGMREIVHRAAQVAAPGDAVILSPGAASMDMFKNFTQRGEQFRAAVTALGVGA